MDRYDRLDRHIDRLLANRRPQPYVAEDDEERAVLEMAARLRLLQPGAEAPRRRFAATMYARLRRLINGPKGTSRRRIVVGGLGGLAAGIIAGLGLAHTNRGPLADLGDRFASPAQALKAAGWAPAGKLQDVPEGGALAFRTSAFSGYIMRKGNQLSALSAICNHMGCHVDWQQESSQFVCPCDGARFDSSGQYQQDAYANAGYGTLQPLTPLAVRKDGDVLYVKPI